MIRNGRKISNNFKSKTKKGKVDNNGERKKVSNKRRNN